MLGGLLFAANAAAQFLYPVPNAGDLLEFDDAGHSEIWLDRAHDSLHNFFVSGARWIDQLGGPTRDPSVYEQASGSIAVAVLWDEFEGVRPKFRFRVNLPLPQINTRLNLFVGRVNRDEYVTERPLPSGAFPRYRTGMDDEQTLAGIVFLPSRRLGGDFDASLGARLRSSELDPYVKVGYRYRRFLWEEVRMTWNENVFWQKSEGFGVTTRVDLERIIDDNWHARWTTSGTIAEESAGVRGYSSLTLTWALPERRALIFQLGIEGETDGPVPVRDGGIKVAHRRSIVRDWLVLELRTSLTWPKELPGAARKPSWGFGVGCEVFFGTSEFSVRPVTL